MSERVYWTHTEELRLAGILARLRLEDPVPSLASLLPRAQFEAFTDPKRQRNINSISKEISLIGLVRNEIKCVLAGAPADTPATKIEIKEVPVQVETEVPVPTRDISVFSTAELVKELGDRAALFDAEEVGAPPPFPAPDFEKTEAAATEARINPEVEDKRPRVLVIGFLDRQQQDLRRNLADVPCHLSFTGKSMPRRKDLPDADLVIVSQFAPDAVSLVKSRYPIENVIILRRGSKSGAETIIRDIVKRRQCEDCGMPIPSARLHAHPEATRCLGCAHLHETANGR